jgi:C4-dicarboxylate transporter DctM subunit
LLGCFSWTASVVGAIDKVTHYIVSIAHTPFAMIMLVNLLLLGLGMIIDAISISYLVLPIIMPMLKTYNIDPIWYGVIFVLALAISQATPPVGVNLFTAVGIIKSDIESIAKEAILFVVAGIIALIVVSFIPGLSLYLPIHGGLYSS